MMVTWCFFDLAPDSGLDPRQTLVPTPLNQNLSAPLFTLVLLTRLLQARIKGQASRKRKIKASFSRGVTLRHRDLHLCLLLG
jgi:hypothetical protein